MIVGFVLCALVFVIINLFLTKAKYQLTESIPIVRGTINAKAYDFKIMAMYTIDDEGNESSIERMPDANSYLINTEKSYCVNGDSRDQEVILKTENGNHIMANLAKQDKCYVWFNEINKYCDASAIACKKVVANKIIEKSKTSFDSIETADGSGKLYETEDDYGRSYYFRGAIKDNWVKFAGFYWRIIRINGNGSIRIIYNGKSSEQMAEDSILSEKVAFNSSLGDNTFVGYMYGNQNKNSYKETHTNEYDSTVKIAVDNWYKENLEKYSAMIDKDSGFCNDRSLNTTSEVWVSNSVWSDSRLGYGKNATAYGPMGRTFLNGSYRTIQSPTLMCKQKEQDLFTLKDAKNTSGELIGNHKLTYPIGLITSDEIIYAGGNQGYNKNTSYYIYTGQQFWTMSPFSYSQGSAMLFFADNSYNLNGTSGSQGVRPVINLASTVKLSGIGTVSDPFVVEGAE